MATQDAEWTGSWVAEKVKSHEEVADVALLDSHTLRISRKTKSDVTVVTTCVNLLDANTLRSLVDDFSRVDMVVNVTSEQCISGDAIAFSSAHRVPIGGMKDLFRALSQRDVASYVDPDIQFIERGLRQHDRVTGFQRLWDRKYRIDRRPGLSSVQVVFLNEYELTGDHIRTARDKYGRFSIVVNSNPNGNATTVADKVAEGFGCTIYKWGQFLGALNRK